MISVYDSEFEDGSSFASKSYKSENHEETSQQSNNLVEKLKKLMQDKNEDNESWPHKVPLDDEKE